MAWGFGLSGARVGFRVMNPRKNPNAEARVLTDTVPVFIALYSNVPQNLVQALTIEWGTVHTLGPLGKGHRAAFWDFLGGKSY